MRMIEKIEEKDYKDVQNIAITCFESITQKNIHTWIVKQLLRKFFKEKNITSRRMRNYELFVYRYQDKVVGFIEVQNYDHISNIFVHPHFQHLGIGKKLMNYAFLYCSQFNKNVITLDALESAMGFYRKLGFISLNRMNRSFGIVTIKMEKKL